MPKKQPQATETAKAKPKSTYHMTRSQLAEHRSKPGTKNPAAPTGETGLETGGPADDEANTDSEE